MSTINNTNMYRNNAIREPLSIYHSTKNLFKGIFKGIGLFFATTPSASQLPKTQPLEQTPTAIQPHAITNINSVSSRISKEDKISKEDENSPLLNSYQINEICRHLLSLQIHTRSDLLEKFDKIIEKICLDPKIFKSKYTVEQCFEIFSEAIRSFNAINSTKINFGKDDTHLFKKTLNSISRETTSPSQIDDLSRVTQNYDRLRKAYRKISKTNHELLKILEGKKDVVCPHLIIGTGDTGTSLWLEKYKEYQNSTQGKLDKGQLPEVLMIGKTFGSWRHDYTLAQPHNLLERGDAKYNPSDYVSRDHYKKNPYANARHIYQSNLLNLSETEAPIVQLDVVRIEKNNNHTNDWKYEKFEYRLIVSFHGKEKAIYTNELNICTGLGPANTQIVGTCITPFEFARLNQFDHNKKFTSIVDGNQFILSPSEELGKDPRTIVIYGGGGTAAACYRKGFFGNDKRTEGREFIEENRKNKMLWIASNGFNAAGGGKLATSALNAAKNRDELQIAKLLKVYENPKNGRLILVFDYPENSETKEIECDQLVYSIGQNDIWLKQISKEFNNELVLELDSTGMPLSVKTRDNKIHFLGAAAMSIMTKKYAETTWNWLHSENIGPDVGPGSMPPSRAQIKRHVSLKKGLTFQSVNANMDNHKLIHEFLENCGVDQNKIPSFVKDIVESRKQSTCGCNRSTLEVLIEKHGFQDKIAIRGHGHLIKKH